MSPMNKFGLGVIRETNEFEGAKSDLSCKTIIKYDLPYITILKCIDF